MDISFEEILRAVGPKTSLIARSDLPIHKVSTDTRTLEKDDLFVALSGERFDGHDFIGEAFKKGARSFVISKKEAMLPEYKETANFILVEDTLTAYGDLARFYRQKFQIPAIAVTGSSGKTTVKELIAHILSQKFNVLKNRGTENNQIGVPKTLLQLESSHEILVVEMGTNTPGEIDRLGAILNPQMGVITQIGQAHLDGLKDLEGVKEEKLKLMSHLERGGVLVLNGQDPLLKEVTSGVHKIVRVGFSQNEGHFSAAQIWCHEKGTSFYLNGKDLFETQLIGRHNVLNCLLAVAVCECLGLELGLVQKGLASFKPVPGRLQLKNVGGVLFLDDSYNANPTSFRSALEALKEFKIREKKGVVCGDMLELGDKAEAFHRELGALVAGFLFDFVIAAGPLSGYLVDEALKSGFDPKRIHHVKDSKEAGQLCQSYCQAGDMVLVKGSRRMHMEKVFECFIPSSIL